MAARAVSRIRYDPIIRRMSEPQSKRQVCLYSLLPKFGTITFGDAQQVEREVIRVAHGVNRKLPTGNW